MKFPKHECSLHLTHNQHKAYYEPIESYVDGDDFDWENEEAKARSIATNEIWELQWYPNTPVGFIRVVAPTLEEVLAMAMRGERE